ncbi:glycogen debranching N-terminal domain-containing protein [Micromonospora sp. WMMD1102]|uniref:amylo-alpha-1,6-glucosidase n=1 Tax=Micromonospora sp. WMMD1102 TaxID=3016105 RepID=UPI0024154083|nr:glycogen debranching N-terminal domain-containing protein [Micromonospora sp. WMMD1102]MDG4790630.1 glycogen debranching N-terminal domain-containing protein [Micromonospora sp. WMMD1102]
MKDRVSILDGNTFVVSDCAGDIEASRTTPTGLFAFDTRFLSRWVLTLNGERLSPISVDDLQYFETRYFLTPGAPTHYVDAKQSVIRQRQIGVHMEERLIVLNHELRAVDVEIRLEADSDFADIFDVKNAEIKRAGEIATFVDEDRLRFSYRRDLFHRETIISSSEPAEICASGISFNVRIEPHGRWITQLEVATVVRPGPRRPSHQSIQAQTRRKRVEMREELGRWLADAPKLVSTWDALTEAYHQGLVDLSALRYVPLISRGKSVPAAGLPWFMTMFGRDSILTSLQMLPFKPELARITLSALGLIQGARLEDFREQEPGKIMHEVRYGESAAFEEQPQSAYYGAADTTPLYVILLDEYERWSGDANTVRDLKVEAYRALDWIDGYGDLMGNGYIWYQRRNTKNGLENQCWKDSLNSISYHDGRLPACPRATCELQGYAYDAKVRGARLARQFWNDPAYADRLEREADELKKRFNRDFWVDDGEYYALALDTDGRPVDALSSNMGHLLWSGIVDEARAQKVVDHLLGPKLFSGWGVRTLAEGEGRYNPVGYHVGTVWPFDNSFIAWGLWRFGFRKEAGRISKGIIDAAKFFNGRLPEAFAGYDRALTAYPVQYPTACSPQAWSAGAPMLLLRTMLGLEPVGDHLVSDPVLPDGIDRIEVHDIPGRWGRTDVVAHR